MCICVVYSVGMLHSIRILFCIYYVRFDQNLQKIGHYFCSVVQVRFSIETDNNTYVKCSVSINFFFFALVINLRGTVRSSHLNYSHRFVCSSMGLTCSVATGPNGEPTMKASVDLTGVGALQTQVRTFANQQRLARVVDIVDGATIDVSTRLRSNEGMCRYRVHLVGLNVPTINTADTLEKAAGLKAKEYLQHGQPRLCACITRRPSWWL